MTESERSASEHGFMVAFEGKNIKNPHKPGSYEAAAWDQGHDTAWRIVERNKGLRPNALDQVAPYREVPAERLNHSRGLRR